MRGPAPGRGSAPLFRRGTLRPCAALRPRAPTSYTHLPPRLATPAQGGRFGRFGHGGRRGRRGRYDDDDEDDGSMTLEEWEAKQKAGRAGAGASGSGGPGPGGSSGCYGSTAVEGYGGIVFASAGPPGPSGAGAGAAGGGSGAAPGRPLTQMERDEELARELQRQLVGGAVFVFLYFFLLLFPWRECVGLFFSAYLWGVESCYPRGAAGSTYRPGGVLWVLVCICW